jgi:hypothetical protein
VKDFVQHVLLVKLTESHKLIRPTIDGDNVSDNVAKTGREYCENHSNDLIRFICFQYKSAMYVACYVK